jgi:hypothetical protein
VPKKALKENTCALICSGRRAWSIGAAPRSWEDSQASIFGAWQLLLLLYSCCEHAAVKQDDMRFPLIPFWFLWKFRHYDPRFVIHADFYRHRVPGSWFLHHVVITHFRFIELSKHNLNTCRTDMKLEYMQRRDKVRSTTNGGVGLWFKVTPARSGSIEFAWNIQFRRICLFNIQPCPNHDRPLL